MFTLAGWHHKAMRLSPTDPPMPEARPMIRCAWERVLMIHYAIEPAILQPHVPFPLDLRDGLAYVSLVAFEMTRIGTGRLGRRFELARIFPDHRFLNLRTYVMHQGEPGIYFLSEWVSNTLAVSLGPPMYGLPYRRGELRYDHPNPEAEYSEGETKLAGSVTGDGGALRYTAVVPAACRNRCAERSLDHFLMERYAAFTCRNGMRRRFLVAHEPWTAASAELTIADDSLLRHSASEWWPAARLLHAVYSTGVFDVSISAPARLGEARGGRGNKDGKGGLVPAHAALLLLPLATLPLHGHLPGWGFMWTLALALYVACKFLTLSGPRPDTTIARVIGYLFLYTGMNALRFLDRSRRVLAPRLSEFLAPLINMGAGVGLLFAMPVLAHEHRWAAAWAGMVGVILLLHFGVFHLMALGWRAAGIDAVPLMNRPIRAASLTDFWSRRWNTGFHDLTETYLFKPLARRFDPAVAMGMSFIASGLIHDLVISVPARGGHGLPTLYFMIQGMGMLIERRLFRRRRHDLICRLYGIAFVAVPLPLLFHGPFVQNVIEPMFRAMNLL